MTIPSPAPPEVLDVQALGTYTKLMRAAGSVTTRVHAYLAASGLSFSQFGVLEALLHRGPLYQHEIGHKLLKSSGNITVVVDHLEQRGLVIRQRDPGDRRRISVSLTTSGAELIQQLFPTHAERIRAAFSVLTASEQQQLAGLCKKLGLANAGAGDDRCCTEEHCDE